MMKREYIEELKKILVSEISDEEKKNQILQYHHNDIASMLDDLTDELRNKLFEILGNEEVAEIILYSDDIGEIIEDLEPEIVADLIEEMDADDAVDVLEELDEEQRDEIVSLIEKDALEEIEAIVMYEDEMLGSKMTNNYIVINYHDTVKAAMKKVISQASENDNVSTIYVLDDANKYYGSLDLRDLIIARDSTSLDTIIKTNYPHFDADDLVEEKLPLLIEYGLDSYPILNYNHELVGVITADDIVEAVDDELSDDYAKLGGLTSEEEIDESVFTSVKKRIPWLVILLVISLMQSFAMTGFESVVAALPIIVFFQTLVLGMAGNSGTQSLAVTIRMLSSEEDGRSKVFKALFKELRIGFFNGLLLGSLAFLLVLGFLYFTNQGVSLVEFDILDSSKGAAIVGFSLMIAMAVSSFVGAVIPILFTKIKIDPAVASGPFITTINDITALLVYYGLAMVLFNILM